MGPVFRRKTEFSDKNMKNKNENWEPYERLVYDQEMRDLWHGLQQAVTRKDLFWIFFYIDRLSTVYSEQQAAKHLPVVQIT